MSSISEAVPAQVYKIHAVYSMGDYAHGGERLLLEIFIPSIKYCINSENYIFSCEELSSRCRGFFWNTTLPQDLIFKIHSFGKQKIKFDKDLSILYPSNFGLFFAEKKVLNDENKVLALFYQKKFYPCGNDYAHSMYEIVPEVFVPSAKVRFDSKKNIRLNRILPPNSSKKTISEIYLSEDFVEKIIALAKQVSDLEKERLDFEFNTEDFWNELKLSSE